MKAFHAIELAIELALCQRDALAHKHQQSHRTLQHGRQQLAQLQTYAGETDGRWGRGVGAELGVEMLRHHYQFRDRLQYAVDLQKTNVANLQAQQMAAQRALLQAEQRLAGLRQVLSSRRAAAQKIQDRREQQQMDELATQKFLQQSAAQKTGEWQ